ncbi:NirD/YgiW/YdeI family stress tolerance protein [Oceanospirillum sp. HFRX-1_2]
MHPSRLSISTLALLIATEASGADCTAITPLAEAKRLPDDSIICIKGHISKRLSDDDFLLKDSSGTLVVEIDNHLWHGQLVPHYGQLLLKGELDNDAQETEFEADSLTILTP